MRRWFVRVAVVLGVVLPALAATPVRAASAPTVVVTGTVTAPRSYTVGELALLPQTTVQVSEPWLHARTPHSDQGVLLESLVLLSQPILPAAKNALLRVTATVGSTEGRRVTFALGELDSNFGNHPALLALSQDGIRLERPRLVVSGDSLPIRDERGVAKVVVRVVNPSPIAPPQNGEIQVTGEGAATVLSQQDLRRLPARTLWCPSWPGLGPSNTLKRDRPWIECCGQPTAGLTSTPGLLLSARTDTWRS
jgi:hypothetical protein